jgi:spermidine synthase
MGAINLGAGLTLGSLGMRRRAVMVPSPGPPGPAPAVAWYAGSALLIGFAAMTLQTVLIRVGGLSLGASQFTFAMVVAVFVLCIAVGSFAVSALPRIGSRLLVGAQWALVALLALLYPALQNAPWAAHVVRTWFRDSDAAFHPYHLAIFAGSLAVLALPVGLSGAMLPLIFHHLRRTTGDLGAAAGRLYAWNTVGSLLGALLGGYVLLFWLDLDQVYRVALAAAMTSAVLLSARAYRLPLVATGFLVLVPALVGIAMLPRWDPARLSSGAFRLREPQPKTYAGANAFFSAVLEARRVIFHEDDPNSTVTVWEANVGGGNVDHLIATNGKPDGSIRVDYPTMALAALVPALFAEQAEQAFVIGFGTGVSAGELAALPSIERVVVAEISPGVIRAGEFFEANNQGPLASPKVEIVVSDAYRALLRSDDRYDVIVSEPSNPWVAGVEMLFSREFLQAARDRLRPGGVYCQWFHLYENDDAVVELVLRTYASVFDHVAVWFSLGPDLLLLGFDDAHHATDLARLRARSAEPHLAAGLQRAGIGSFPALLAHEVLPLDVVNAAGFEGDVQTLMHPVLSHRAGRAFFRGRMAGLPSTARPEPAAVGTANSLLRKLRQGEGGVLSDEQHDQIAGAACNNAPTICATFLARWQREHPVSPAREALLDRLRQHPGFSPHVTPVRLNKLAALFAADSVADVPATPEEASRFTNLFVEYYHHAAPFSREALARVWGRCADPGAGVGRSACARGLAAAEARVGPLRPAAHAAREAPPG